uniref:Anaphylatoxin-like domain-containing protein n=1 Tax=Electrophorus electricus TaxID=8005 RepID=A0A4W4GV93_ELEEL
WLNKCSFIQNILLLETEETFLFLCPASFIMSAPNLLRVGGNENVFVEAQDYAGNDFIVKVMVKNYPQKTVELTSTSVTLRASASYQALVNIKIPDKRDYFSDDPLQKQYVYLHAQFPTRVLEKVVMVSFQSGYIFIQTDKSIYTPSSTVLYRIFSVSSHLEPLDQGGISVDIINFTAEFEVKEYVLPTFEVTLKPSRSFFYVDDVDFKVNIIVTYLFGKKVDGSAFVVFGVMQGDSKTSLPASLSRVQITNGEGDVTLTKAMIQKTFPDVHKLVGNSIYISVSVLTDTGSEMVEAQRRGIQIVTSPYTIHFKRTPKFFKPGISFDVMVYVTNPDQTPAENVQVEVSPGAVLGRTKDNGMAKVTVNSQGGAWNLPITVKTKDPQLTNDRQAVNQMTALPYTSKKGSNNYLHIGIDASEPVIGDQIKVNLHFGKSPGVQNQDFTYLVLSKGQIVQAKRFKRQGQSLVTLTLHITKDMVPSFRVVAYYHVGSSEVVSDSVWVDVKDTCMGTLEVSVKDPKGSYEPGDDFVLTITGDPGAKVGLVAVDKGIFVLNKNRLTQTKIWDIIEKHDTGCTAGSGKDSMGVFYDAGLLFESDKAGGTDSRTTPDCPAPLNRKRRAISLLQITTTLIGKYSGDLKKCCGDGLKKNNLGYTCERRAAFITDGAECIGAFLHCCTVMLTHTKKEREEELYLARKDDEAYLNPDDIISRTQFPESWLWEDPELPPCQGNHVTTTLTMKENYLKDSITTWQVLAISLSKTHGICVADPYEMVVVKDFFVDLKLPYSAVRNEQLEIKAILHNYSNRRLERMRVDFLETEHICSAASKKGKFRMVVSIDARSSRSVSYILIPMEIGEHSIEVKVSGKTRSDGVRKTLKVVVSFLLVQDSRRKNSSQQELQNVYVKTEIPDGQIPNSPADTYITVSGQEVSQTIEQAISGEFMGRLIVQPHGCGEQNMIFMTLPLIATHYLDSTKQWEGVGASRRGEAIKHIQTGYEKELTFRKQDGSYGAWINTPSSTWLTAYVGKVFALASDLVAIQENVLCSALKWLILNTQMPDGMFKEGAPVYHGEMGDVRGKDSDASLTAFVVIALQEGHKLCAKFINNLPDSIKKAIEYLERKIPTLTNPYAVAMTSYAMANADKFNKKLLMKYSSGDGSYWQVPRGLHFSLEATGYALLALVKAKEYDAAGKAVHWLNKQSSPYGGHGTTQATIIVFQAVAEYYMQVKKIQNMDLQVDIVVTGRNRPISWIFKNEYSHLTHSEKVKLKQEFKVTAKGTGMGSLQVWTVYYARPIEKQSDCKMFNLAVKMGVEARGKIQYMDPNRDATMSILDVGLLTGFVVDENDLADLTTGSDKYISKFEMDKQLSERGSLIIYVDKISHREADRIAFRLHKVTEVAMLQPAAVSVYEYYSPGNRCVKFYHPIKKGGALTKLCDDQEGLCQCAEENCSIQKKEKINEGDRDLKACEAGMDYVYKTKVVSMDFTPYTDTYKMKIEKVLKIGSDVGVEGQVRSFIGHANCKESFGFEEGKTYLIMGQSIDLPRAGGRLQYILGEKTWIEYWPTSEEGQTAKYKDRYIGITQLSQTLHDFACST